MREYWNQILQYIIAFYSGVLILATSSPAIAKAGNPAAVDYPQCAKAHVAAMNKCIGTAQASSAAGSAAIQQGTGTANNIEGTGNDMGTATAIGAGANNATAAACKAAETSCTAMCEAAAIFHNRESNNAQNLEQAKIHGQLVVKSRETKAKCKQNLGLLSGLSTANAVALGAAGLAAAGVVASVVSSRNNGGATDSSHSEGTPGEDSEGTENPNGNDDSNNTVVPEDAENYWASHNCQDVISGAIQPAEASIGETCHTIATDSNNTDFVLGSCANPDQAAGLNCFNKLDSYCMLFDKEAADNIPACSSFCGANAHADACTRIIAETNPDGVDPQNPDGNQNPNNGGSGAQPTSTGVAQSQANDCSHPTLVLTPACDAPMRSYCSQYGTQGAGCRDYCQFNSGVCPN